MNPFQSLRNYEEFIYTLKERHASIKSSTLIIIQRGRRTALVQGEIAFDGKFRIANKERLSFDEGQVIIESYGYEFWANEDKIAWYDSQPHPNDASLANSYPYHKHIPPDIKHNRIPAPEIHFDQPNLPFLIKEVEDLLKKNNEI